MEWSTTNIDLLKQRVACDRIACNMCTRYTSYCWKEFVDGSEPVMAFRSRCMGCVLLVCLAASRAYAIGGTAVVATKGEPVAAASGWPEGVLNLVNDPTRTSGWNSWFSEWPNDVNQYAFEGTTTADLNRLIEKLAAVKSDLRQIRLSPLREPNSLGWVTRLEKGNQVAAIFSIGDQERIDEWYEHVRQPFGQLEFISAPTAVPPTLTIFVANKSVDLDDLKIPKGITVTRGNLPAVFHRFNTKDEKKRKEEAKRKPPLQDANEKLSPDEQAAAGKIGEFLKKWNERDKK